MTEVSKYHSSGPRASSKYSSETTSGSSDNILYKVLYHNTRNRKLPDLNKLLSSSQSNNNRKSSKKPLDYKSLSTQDIIRTIQNEEDPHISSTKSGISSSSSSTVNKHELSSDMNKTKINQTNKRSLPLLPEKMSANEPIIKVENLKKSESESKPPAPVLKTNALDDLMTASDYSSSTDTEDNNSIDNNNNRPSSILQQPIAQNYPNINQLLNICRFESSSIIINITNSITDCVILHTQLLDLNKSILIDIPQGNRANIGYNTSSTAFKLVSNTKLKNNQSNCVQVTVVKEIIDLNNNLNINNFKINDIIIMLDNQYVGDKSLDRINQSLSKLKSAQLVIGRLPKNEINNDKKKDEQIKLLEEELKSLQQKYSFLHKRTEENNQIIRQLNYLLKK